MADPATDAALPTMNRRQLLVLASAAVACASCGETTELPATRPAAEPAPASSSPSTAPSTTPSTAPATAPATSPATGPAAAGPFDAGPVASFASGVSDAFAKAAPKVFVVRANGRLHAASAVCTHKACTVRVEGDGFLCKCHRSQFDRAGVVLTGPAVRALPRYAVSVDARGHLIVDTSRRFERESWDDPAAFVKV